MSAQPSVLSFVDDTHPTTAELSQDLVTPEGLPYQRGLQTQLRRRYLAILDLWGGKGNFRKMNLREMVYILIRRIDGSILSYHTGGLGRGEDYLHNDELP